MRACSLRVAVVGCVVIIVIFFFAVVFLFVLVLAGLLSEDDIGTRRGRIRAFWLYFAHAQSYARSPDG